MMKKPVWILAISIFFLHCAGKTPPMVNQSIPTIPKLRIGMVNLSENDLKESSLYDCMENYPSVLLTSSRASEHELSSAGYSKDMLINMLRNQQFEAYKDIKNFSVLLLLFKNNQQQNYVRLVNFLSQKTRTLAMSPDQLTCENLFSTARLLSIDSHPPFADVYINDRMIGEAPLWTSLQDGTYDVQCKLDGNVFDREKVTIPGTTQYLCKRQNQQTANMESEGDNTTPGEKMQAWVVYGVIGVLSVSGAVLPFVLF